MKILRAEKFQPRKPNTNGQKTKLRKTDWDVLMQHDRFSGKLEQYQGNLIRSAHELAKEWRTDKMLRPLESVLVAVDRDHTLLISGTGEVIEPDDGVIGIGSGGPYATAAARALLANTELGAARIVEESMRIAADLCVYTNQQIRIERISAPG